jgi:2-C-methyl-D-erythritol 4-phosphate cytidylyltransferase
MRLTSALIIESGMHSTNSQAPKCHVVLPTAGVGLRLGGELPKQFQQLAGRPMLGYALDAFMQTPQIETVWVAVSYAFIDNPILAAVAENPAYAKPLRFMPTGGPTRQETVKNTLAAMLMAGISENDWVLVHDAARPGITPALIDQLIAAVSSLKSGGLLAIPVADTLKHADYNSAIAGNPTRVDKTISRDHLWQAQTPQMFCLKQLHDALETAILSDADLTDEASAMELTGIKPLLVQGSIRNFKVTHPADWELMQLLLSSGCN